MLNSIQLMGRLTADPELHQTQSGIAAVSFRLAIDRDYLDKETNTRPTDFIPCIAWRGTAEFIQKYFQKGQMVVVTGSLQSRNYEDKQGQKRTAYEVVVDTAHFCGSKQEAPAVEEAAE